MMAPATALLVEVFLHEGRYHGTPEWPPSPARLFQALLAGASRAGRLPPEADAALRWLEALPAPIVGGPRAVAGQAIKLWVPNNDLDAKGGNPEAVASIRTGKHVQPRLFDAEVPLLYAWTFDDEEDARTHAADVASLAKDLYQLGRGVDPAWARTVLVDEPALARRLEAYAGRLYRPSGGEIGGTNALSCPERGSLDSLNARYKVTLGRFVTHSEGRKRVTVFQQPPKPLFRNTAYDSTPRTMLFELRLGAAPSELSAFPITDVCPLIERLRDAAAQRLEAALPERSMDVERAIVGRTPEGARPLPPADRVRIVLLPSIGHRHADRRVRRVLIQVPTSCPWRADDVFWAFSDLAVPGSSAVLCQAGDDSMLVHYGSRDASFTWRTVTPAALPAEASRRRIDPQRQAKQAKGAEERAREEAAAIKAVRQALRHAAIGARLASARVQREPFEGKGERAERFARGTRFAKERLWHIEVTLERPVNGPVVIGDGRFLGLGLMAPVTAGVSVGFMLPIIEGWREGTDPLVITRALRRAVMARYQEQIGAGKRLPRFVSGHEPDGSPAKNHSHLHFVCDPDDRALLVVPPHARDRRDVTRWERSHLSTLRDALTGFVELRAGDAGLLRLGPAMPTSPFASSREWISTTPYVVNRHRKEGSAKLAVERDVRAACREAQLPSPAVDVLDVRGEPRTGLTAHVALVFPTTVVGPVLLGRTRHQGGGWFKPASAP